MTDVGPYYQIAYRAFCVHKSSDIFACGGHLLFTKLTIPSVGLSLIPSSKLNENWHWFWPLLPDILCA